MLVNGEKQDWIGLNNRGLAFGDGLFESVLLHAGQPVFLERHLQRLARGCERLGIADCRRELQADIRRLEGEFAAHGVLKIIVTRAPAPRGYRSVPGPQPPERILTLHPRPDYSALRPQEGIRAFVCRQRLALQPALAGIKHLNRLEQVLASREWPEEDVMEGLMLDTEGMLVEGTRSNVFWASQGRLYTPDLELCGIEGVMREILLQAFRGEAECGHWPLENLLAAEEVFFCNSVGGVWPLLELKNGQERHDFRPGAFCRRAQQLFRESLAVYEA